MSTETIDPDSIADDGTQIAAFTSGGYAFKGIPLKPMSAMRMAAAQAAGLRFGSLSPEENASFQKSQTYRGLTTDVLLVLYLCQADQREVMLAFRKPDDVLERALKFGDKHDIVFPNANFNEAAGVFSAILMDISNSSAGELTKESQERVKEDSGNSDAPVG